MGHLRLISTLVPRGPAAAIVLDDAQVAAVGEGAKRSPVVAMVNGYTWHTTVTRMRGEFLLGGIRRRSRTRGHSIPPLRRSLGRLRDPRLVAGG